MSPWLYIGFIAFVIAMLLVDLKLFHTEAHTPTTKESGTWVAIWVGLALAFGVGLWFVQGSKDAGEYFAGYLIEYSLSVDNMFVFVVIFAYFKIPLSHQHQVLFYGILGAMIFRGIFIALGTALVQNFDWVIPLFGLFLLYTAYKIAKGSAEHVNPEDNPVLKFARKRFRTTHNLDGQKLFTMENGKRVATPLFIVLLFIETTDIFFAIDSIPAIFAVTKEPFIVLTSNVFAILGLRALYFLLAGGMDRLHLLKYGLAIILGFVGVKMLLEGTEIVGLTDHAIHVPIWLSLTVIIGVLTATAILSFKIPPKEQTDIEHRVSPDSDADEADHQRR
ncbi:MAG TPA: TerC family protein [Actinomycetota bacterium]|nr:TerC family protein [Actinomycetota bacterium]